MIKRSALLLACAAALYLGLSCEASTGPRTFPWAVATFSCGPADGPATGIALARKPIQDLHPSYPYVSVLIQRSVSDLGETEWNVEADSFDISATYVRGANHSEQAIAGTVRIDRVGSDKQVEGRVELRFPSTQVSDGFSAVWVESLVMRG